jgi:predicted deacylase
MVAAHHGNELGTPVVALYAITRLTEGYGTDPTITELVNEHEIWIAPVWNPDGYPDSRKNRRPGGGVDLNRNYPFLWDTECSGSTNPASGSFKGPTPGSEPETQTMIAFSEDQRFAKVLDYHSSGRETLYGYRCNPHHLRSYLETEAIALSQASSYLGASRRPSAEGEHYQWQLGNFGSFAFLTEISDTQSPAYADAVAEAIRLWPGTQWMLQRPIPIWGHVRDADTGEPLSADISYLEHPFSRGEKNGSEPRHGRFHAFLPQGTHTVQFSLPGYIPQDVPVTVSAEGVQLEVSMHRDPGG